MIGLIKEAPIIRCFIGFKKLAELFLILTIHTCEGLIDNPESKV